MRGGLALMADLTGSDNAAEVVHAGGALNVELEAWIPAVYWPLNLHLTQSPNLRRA